MKKLTKNNKIRAGLIIDDCDQSSSVLEIYKNSTNAKNYEICCLIIQSKKEKNINLFLKIVRFINKNGLEKLISLLLFKIIRFLEKKIALRNKKFRYFFKKYKIDNFPIKKIIVSPKISNSGFIYHYTENDLKKINNEKLDILIRAGSGILKGKILNLCSLGILSFHHGNNDFYRGGPPAFWEVYKKEPSTGFIIQKLNSELDGGDVIFKGSIPTSGYYILNLIKIYRKSIFFMNSVLEKIGRDKSYSYTYPKKPYYNRLFITPSLYELIIYSLKTAFYFINKINYKLQPKKLIWNVAYQFSDNWKSSVLRKSIVIQNPKNRFLADPFIYIKDNNYYCFVEDYNLVKKKGSISIYKITNNGYEFISEIISEEFHLSFPYIFEFNKSLYLCPESNSINEIRLYKCKKFPYEWEYHSTIMKNVRAVDNMIIKYKNLWWLLTNIDSANVGDTSSELHIFSSKSPLTKNWKPHKLNPVIFNAIKARNGGFIKKDGSIYRVHQKQGFSLYGESMGISKIIEINNHTYEEQEIFNIKPEFFKGIVSTHTINSSGNLTVFDYAKFK